MPTLTLFAVADDSPRIAEAEALGLTEVVAGPMTPTEQRQAWQTLSRTPPAAVWIDWTGLTPLDLPSLRRFRVSAPQTRIILEVPETLEPPNDALAQVVSLQITDIVRSAGASMAAVLAHPGTYADVAVWQGQVRTFADPEPEPKERVVERIVEREVVREVVKKVASTARPVLISVWGFAPGTGATTLSVAFAEFLAGIAPTAVVDHAPPMNAHGHPRPGQTGLSIWAQTHPPMRGLTWVTSAITPDGAVVLPSAREVLKSHEFAYVVVDAGLDPPKNDSDGLALWNDSDLAILVIPPASTRWQGVWPWLDRQVQIEKQYTAVVLGSVSPIPDPDDLQRACVSLPWPGSPGHDGAVAALLAPVLPDDLRPRKRHRRRKPRPAQVPRPETTGLTVQPEDPIDRAMALRTPPARPARRPIRPGHRAMEWVQTGWDLVLLSLFLAVVGLVIWLFGALEGHLPGFAHSPLGQWIGIIAHWEGHWFRRVPPPASHISKGGIHSHG